MKLFLLAFLSVLTVYAMEGTPDKRKASDEDINKRPNKIARGEAMDVEETGEVETKQLAVEAVVVEGAANDDEDQVAVINGDELPFDIWHAILSRSDGFSLHPSSAVNKKFRRTIFSEPALIGTYISRESFVEGLVNASYGFNNDNYDAVGFAASALVVNNVADAERFAKLFLHCRSRKAFKTVYKKLPVLVGDNKTELFNNIASKLLKHAEVFQPSLKDLPQTLEEFEQFIAENEGIDPMKAFPFSGFLLPYMHMTSSPELTKALLETSLLKCWKKIVLEKNINRNQIVHTFANNPPSVFRRLKYLTNAMDHNEVYAFARKLAMLATSCHGSSNNILHEIFGIMIKELFEGAVLPNLNVALTGDLKATRDVLEISSEKMMAMLRMGVAWNLPVMNFVQVQAVRLKQTSLKGSRKNNVQEVMNTIKAWEKLAEIADSKNMELAHEIILAMTSDKKLTDYLTAIWTAPKPTFDIMINLIAREPARFQFLLKDFVKANDWTLHESLLNSENRNVRITDNFEDTESLFKAYQVFSTLGSGKAFISGIVSDIIYLWLNEESAVHINTLLNGHAKLAGKVCLYLQNFYALMPCLVLSGKYDEFKAQFTFFSEKDDAGVEKFMEHAHWKRTYEKTFDLFGLVSDDSDIDM